MATNIDNSMDIIDSRDVIERIEELGNELSGLNEAVDEARSALDEARTEQNEADEDAGPDELNALAEAVDDAENRLSDAKDALHNWNGSEGIELETLRALAEEVEGYASDWRHGEALIRDSYFQDYAQQLAEDIGAINADASWPNNCIDWEQAARELQMDYTAVDFDGVTYWVRS